MKLGRSLLVAGGVCFCLAFILLGLEMTHVVPFSELYSLAIIFAFVVAGFLMMLAFSQGRNRPNNRDLSTRSRLQSSRHKGGRNSV